MSLSFSLSSDLSLSDKTHPNVINKPVTELPRNGYQEAGASSTALLNHPIEYEPLMGARGDVFFKQLTESDVSDRLVVTKKMAMLMPRANDSEIRVLDDIGDTYRFTLTARNGSSLKPTFQPRAWKSFVKKRGGKSGDRIYFWQEVNEFKGTSYRIDLIPFIHGVSPHPEGLANSNSPSAFQEDPSDLRSWAAHGGDLKL
ncbi:hypothetical protein ACLB2K_049558 [Fragaria x ananassa]